MPWPGTGPATEVYQPRATLDHADHHPRRRFSRDGSRIVLEDVDDPGRLMAVRLDDPEAEPLVVRPRGRVGYYALSSDGATLFLLQTIGAGRQERRRIRAVDLASGELLPGTVAPLPNERVPVSGEPAARASTAAFAYTLYAGGQMTFVHALPAAAGGPSWSVVLPEAARSEAVRGAWSLTASLAGPTVVAGNGRLGVAYGVRDDGDVLPLGTTSTFVAPRGAAHCVPSPEGVVVVDRGWAPITRITPRR